MSTGAVGFIGSGSSRMSISSAFELGAASEACDFPSPVPSAVSGDGFGGDLRPVSGSAFLLPRSGSQTPVPYERRASVDSSTLDALIEEDKMCVVVRLKEYSEISSNNLQVSDTSSWVQTLGLVARCCFSCQVSERTFSKSRKRSHDFSICQREQHAYFRKARIRSACLVYAGLGLESS